MNTLFKVPSMFYLSFFVFGVAMLFSCSSSESIFLKDESLRPNWEERMEKGLGKADFTTDELVNLDYWPLVINQDEVSKKILNVKSPLLLKTCSHFLGKQEEGYEIVVEFLLDEAGEKNSARFLNEVGPCDNLFEDVLKDLIFRPGVRNNQYVQAYVIYSFRTNYIKQASDIIIN